MCWHCIGDELEMRPAFTSLKKKFTRATTLILKNNLFQFIIDLPVIDNASRELDHHRIRIYPLFSVCRI